jgi:ribosomal protein S18 acetylase RimI-like enzyme
MSSAKNDVMFEYSEMNIKHFDEAYEIWKQSEEVALTIGDTKESFEKYLSRNPGMSYVCIDKNSDSVIGTILCGHDGRRGFIYHLTVKKEFRGKSIGKTLLEKSISALKAEGIKRCMIMVKTSNDTGKNFWEKSGWNKRDDLIIYSSDVIKIEFNL